MRITWCSGVYINPVDRKVFVNGVDMSWAFPMVGESGAGWSCAFRYVSNGEVTLGPGANEVKAQLGNQHGQSVETATYSYRVLGFGVSVTPDNEEIGVTAGAPISRAYQVTNTGTVSATYDLLAVWSQGTSQFSPVATGCTLTQSQVTLAGGASATVTMNCMAGAGGKSGTLRVRATRVGSAANYDEGSVQANVGATTGSQMTPSLTVGDGLPGALPTPGLCLTMPAGTAGAYQCGDLVVAHALPTVRTLNRSWTPTLVYNSAHAVPMVLAGANVALSNGYASPTRVTAALTIGAGVAATREWNGAEWVPGKSRRITLGTQDLLAPTGLYNYTLEVTNWYGTTPKPATIAWTANVVNRRASPFGEGWWLAGFEQLDVGTMRWTGGDGAQRRYTVVTAGIRWATTTVTHGDTLVKVGTEYHRLLPGGGKVIFDAAGRHVATVDMLGRRTLFSYDASQRLEWISVPIDVGAAPSQLKTTHRFNYDPQGRLASVTSYDSLASWTPGRTVTFSYELGDRRVTRITDPDGRWTSFAYTLAGAGRMTSRTDRGGSVTSFVYDAAGKLTEASVGMGAGEAPVRTRWYPAESRGWTHSTLFNWTRVDGPREDVPDVSFFWVNRFGAPTRIQEPEPQAGVDGRTTFITYDNAFPAFVRKVKASSGRVMTSTFTARGAVQTVTDSATWVLAADGVTRIYATTQYQYNNPSWPHFPTRIIPPTGGPGDSIAYNLNGTRRWMQDARGDSTRVNFYYNSRGLVDSVRTRADSLRGHPAERYQYDTLGNLVEVRGPLGELTRHRLDQLGRAYRTVLPPPNGVATDSAYVLNVFDRMDRVRRTESVGPAVPLSLPTGTPRVYPHSNAAAERVVVESYFNAMGQPDSVVRWAVPDPALVGRQKTSWTYDELGRTEREIAADGAISFQEYDPAGNVTAVVTRRGYAVRSRYDVMNRLVQRITPEVSYQAATIAVTGQNWIFPRFTQAADGTFTATANGGGGLVIPADTAVFLYDSVGMYWAQNRDAVTSRALNLNGSIRSETQQIRSYLGTSFSQHSYLLQYEYDLAGRRTVVVHPSGLAPAAADGGTGRTEYTYYTHGQLATVRDVMGGLFTYHWDAEGALASREGATTQTFTYDASDRLGHRAEVLGENPLHDETYTYDARGKVLAVTPVPERQEVLNRYSGLGALVYTRTADELNTRQSVEEYVLDPFANYVKKAQVSSPLGQLAFSGTDQEDFAYEALTGRLLVRAAGGPSGPSNAFSSYDIAGNLRVAETREYRITGYTHNDGEAAVYSATVHYYGADERLRVLDRRTCLLMQPCMYQDQVPSPDEASSFEEYRYDALGRRVFTRARQEFICPLPSCVRSALRTVWDGDQILYEISAPGGSSTGVVEADTGLAPQMASNTYFGFGRVVYAHGLGIDDPLSLVRMEYSDTIPEPVRIIPTSNWAGRYDGGIGGRCVALGSQQVREVVWAPGEREDDVGTIPLPPPGGGGTQEHCVRVAWPAQALWMNLDRREFGNGAPSWMGSLVRHGRDPSGQYYRRSRYYDATAGRFTQEDPIGLAGSVNLYGYGNGDPVSHSDPYGLSADSVKYRDPELKRHVAELRAADSKFDEGMRDLEEDVNYMYVFEMGRMLNSPGNVWLPVLPQNRLNPGDVETNQPIVSIMFDWSHIDGINAHLERNGLSGGPVTPQMVVGHEVYVHAVPFSRSGGREACSDVPHTSADTCGRRRHNELGQRLDWAKRVGW